MTIGEVIRDGLQAEDFDSFASAIYPVQGFELYNYFSKETVEKMRTTFPAFKNSYLDLYFYANKYAGEPLKKETIDEISFWELYNGYTDYLLGIRNKLSDKLHYEKKYPFFQTMAITDKLMLKVYSEKLQSNLDEITKLHYLEEGSKQVFPKEIKEKIAEYYLYSILPLVRE